MTGSTAATPLAAAALAATLTLGSRSFVASRFQYTATGANLANNVALRGSEAAAPGGNAGASPLLGLAFTVAGAGAFAAAGRAKSQKAGRAAVVARRADGATFDPATEIGAMAPLGFFDPLSFAKAGDKAGFNNLRAAEIKHGRVAMMAAVGAVVQHYIKFPGFEDVPSALSAVTTAPGTYGFAALFVFSGLMELAIWTQDEKKEPGNFGDPAGLGMYNPDMRAKEINNGRIAMFSAIGIILAETLTGKDGIQQLGF